MRWIPPRRPVAAVLASATALGAATAVSAPLPRSPPTTRSSTRSPQPQQFQSPGNAVRPQLRWWWGSLFGARRGRRAVAGRDAQEIAAMDDAGFGSFEIAFGPGKWATAEQRENLEAALLEARDRDMTVDMTVGASWPVRTPNTAPGSGLSLQELQYGRERSARRRHLRRPGAGAPTTTPPTAAARDCSPSPPRRSSRAARPSRESTRRPPPAPSWTRPR